MKEPEPTEEPTETPTEMPTETPSPSPTPEPAAVATPAPDYGPFNLEIRYEYLDGRTAAPTYYGMYMAGDTYNITNPVIDGYMTARITVHGTMQFGDAVIVVLYIPADMASQGETISIDEYESPLGLNDLYAQMGICVE